MKSIEWPTLSLFLLVHLVWVLLTLAVAYGFWPGYLLLAIVLTQYASLQHEAIHGHPTRWPSINALLVFPALGLLLPFERFRDLHLQHHRNWLLTDPYDDTESYFLTHSQWQALSPLHRKFLQANNTLVGRLIIGPWLMYTRFYTSEARLLQQRAPGIASSWLRHIAGVAPVLLWLGWLDISLIAYLLIAVWPSTSLVLLRAYTEHLPAEAIDERSAIIASNPLMGLLYLNNNYHVVHHNHPELPWYQIPVCYRKRYADIRGAQYIAGYLSIIRQHAFRGKFPVAHPHLHTQAAKDADH